MAGAVANIARTSSLGTARRRLIGIIRASVSPLRVSVYDRTCRRPRVTDPESATNWRTLISVERSSGVAMGEAYPGVPRLRLLVFLADRCAWCPQLMDAVRLTLGTGSDTRQIC